MDGGAAYLKYREENPVINTFITTYEHVTMFPEQLTERGCPEFCVNGASVNSSASFPQIEW